MTNAKDLLSLSKTAFDDGSTINLYKPKKIRDRYGYQYLSKGAPKKIRGSIHRERGLESNSFGLYDNSKIIISTNDELSLGDLIEYNGALFAVNDKKNYNEKTNINHYEALEALEYYKDFIIDDLQKANVILGVDCSRFLLDFAIDNDLDLISSRFAPKKHSFFSFDILSSRVFSSVRQNNNDNLLEQDKQDNLIIYAVNKNTNEILEFENALQFKSKSFGLGDFVSFEPLKVYNQALDIKGNIYQSRVSINYTIRGNVEQGAIKKIEKVFYDLRVIEKL